MSYSPSQPSPAPPLSRASMVIGLYGAMALVALVIAAGRGDPDLYRFGSEPRWPEAVRTSRRQCPAGVSVDVTTPPRVSVSFART